MSVLRLPLEFFIMSTLIVFFFNVTAALKERKKDALALSKYRFKGQRCYVCWKKRI